MDPVASSRSIGPAIPHHVLAVVALVLLLALAFSPTGGAAPAPLDPHGTNATVAGRTCTVYAASPRPTYGRTGQRVEARMRFGECRGEAVSSRSNDALGSNDNLYDRRLISRQASGSCADGRYRLLARITVHDSRGQGSATDLSRVVDVAC